MYVEMDLNTVKLLTFVVYKYMCIKQNCFCNHFMFTLFCAQN